MVADLRVVGRNRNSRARLLAVFANLEKPLKVEEMSVFANLEKPTKVEEISLLEKLPKGIKLRALYEERDRQTKNSS